MSARSSIELASRACSGDMYAGVPSMLPVRVLCMSPPLLDTSFAIPKSRILITTGVRAEPSVARNRLSGLRSRWTMPRSWAADSALAT